jgi:tetratricopeptide (TPR) repeat protein
MALLTCLAIWIIASMAGAQWLVIRMDPLRHARNAYLSGDYRAALRAAEDHLTRWPGNREAGLMAARCLSQMGRHQEAEAYYNRSGTIGLDELQVHTSRLARDLIAHRQTTEARGYLERALDGHEDAGVLELLGVCYENEGALEKAEEYWRRAVCLDSKNSAALLDLGRLAISARRLDEAVSLLERAAELSPGSIDPVYNLSRAYRLKGEIARAKHFEDLADRLRQSEPPRGGMGEVPEMELETPSTR